MHKLFSGVEIMSHCPNSPPKHRHNRGKGHASDYKHGMRKHSWKKLIINDVHVGRVCKNCDKKIIGWMHKNERNNFK